MPKSNRGVPKVIKINLKDLQTQLGLELARSIYSTTGQLLLAKGTILQISHINKLLTQGLNEVYLSTKTEPIIPTNEEAPPKYASRSPVSSRLNPYIGELFTYGQEVIRDLFARIMANRPVNVKDLAYTVDLLYPEIMVTNNIFIQLRHLRNKDEYTLQHSVAVAILCIKIGQTQKFPEKILKQLGMAGLLHDIGKSRLPLEILNKSGPLTPHEYKEIKKHPILGYQVLLSANLSDRAIETAVLQHHERIDGSGYPLHTDVNHIHPYAKIIAVADIFDALTSDRIYRPKVSPFTAADEIRKATFGHLDPLIAHRFITYFINLSAGEVVRLNTGELAEIILMNQYEPNRPLVKTRSNKFIDLTKDRNFEIQEVIN